MALKSNFEHKKELLHRRSPTPWLIIVLDICCSTLDAPTFNVVSADGIFCRVCFNLSKNDNQCYKNKANKRNHDVVLNFPRIPHKYPSMYKNSRIHYRAHYYSRVFLTNQQKKDGAKSLTYGPI